MSVPFVVTIIGELENSNSIRHTHSQKNFIKNFSYMKFKHCSKIFADIEYEIFIKFNRFIGFEIIMQSYNKFKNFKKYKFKIHKKKILKDIYLEALQRNSEGSFFSYFAELKILRKKIDIDLKHIYHEFRILIINRLYKLIFTKDLAMEYFITFKNSDKLNINSVLKNIEK
jgi:hypothetical protein